MDAEIKAKLEEMANEYAEVHYRKNSTELFGNICEDYKAGFESAWTLAVEWERARCARLIANAGSSEDDRHRAIGEILAPSEEVKR